MAVYACSAACFSIRMRAFSPRRPSMAVNRRPKRAHPRYTTLLGAIELEGAVQADGPQRLIGDDTLPPGDGLVGSREEDVSEQIEADPEDGLGAAFVGLD